jgi:hypothetical protein
VPPEASWDNTMRLVIHDVRYGALKAMGEKKAAFNEYCTVGMESGLDGAEKAPASRLSAVLSCVWTPQLHSTD